MPKRVQFSIPKLPMSLNRMLTTHWSYLHREKAQWDLHILSYWLAYQKFIFLKPVRITYTLGFCSNRTRDYDNYLGGTKYITDSIRKTFITRDDALWLTEIGIRFEKVEGRPRTKVLIEEVEEDEIVK